MLPWCFLEQTSPCCRPWTKLRVGRGVRRVFVICVGTRGREKTKRTEPGPVMEWSASDDAWRELAPDSIIEDPCLCCPIQVRALLDAAEADNAVARALLAQGNPVLEEAHRAAEARGEARGYELGSVQILREAICDLCEAFAIELTPAKRARMETLDAAGLRALRDRIKAHRRWDE